MEMIKPTGAKMPSFDSTKKQLFQFYVDGGNQVTQNKLIIKNNETNIIIYENTIESYKFEQELPPNILNNNKYYSFSFVTLDKDNNTSEPSNPIPFYCYTTPTITFQNIPIDNIIKSANFKFVAVYNQIEGELIDNCSFILYDASGIEVYNSGNLYNSNSLPVTFDFQVNGLLDDYTYKILAKAVTINGNIITTGLIEIGVNYYNPKLFSLTDYANNCENGYVEIKNNMKIIDGISYPKPPIYIDGKKIYLNDDGYYLKWIDGYSINSDFTLGLLFENPNIGEEFNISILSNDKNIESNPHKITINLIKDYENDEYTLETCAELKCYSDNKLGYYIYSNFIKNPKLNEKLFIWIRRIKNIFLIKLEKLSELEK